ncbi:nickel pincer cofactor biosynthesis protein LarB [Dehalobacter sp. DCM]|uniref:nickel pincer cofactor biosynthesis protein LarB n=1 Tax=Dehalobacter sp. DCM TaxID=2907827 RepID=UPI003081388B|nr:nickel pincer cofactor biosynthesis protein LarB [Dehalobacter sp. DCM]
MKENIKEILNQVQTGMITVEEGQQWIEQLYGSNLGFARLDIQREHRKGFPEAIFCPGKTTDQILQIAKKLYERSGQNVVATRANKEIFDCVHQEIPTAEFNAISRTILIRKGEQRAVGNILVVTAGTSDLPVAEEAAVTAQAMGNRVERLYDTGVAGLHRLLAESDKLQQANVLIVVAGMDGVLPSVVGGLVSRPVIAVPTSVGYGANFGGIAPLLTMLNSCAEGIGVVNIDNGFGAGYLASLINQIAT